MVFLKSNRQMVVLVAFVSQLSVLEFGPKCWCGECGPEIPSLLLPATYFCMLNSPDPGEHLGNQSVILLHFQQSVCPEGTEEDTARISQGDGDLDGNRGSCSGEGEGNGRNTGINDGLHVTRSPSE